MFKKSAWDVLLRLKDGQGDGKHSGRHLYTAFALSHVLYFGMYANGFENRMHSYTHKLQVYRPVVAQMNEEDVICVSCHAQDDFNDPKMKALESHLIGLGVLFGKWKQEKLLNNGFSNAQAKQDFWESNEIRRHAFALFAYVTSEPDRVCIFTKKWNVDGSNLEQKEITQQELAHMIEQAKAPIGMQNLFKLPDATAIVQKILPSSPTPQASAVIFARLHSSRTLILCSEQRMPRLEEALHAKKLKFADHREIEEKINQHFAKPPIRTDTLTRYDHSLGNFPLTERTALTFMRDIARAQDYSHTILDDVTVVIEHKIVFRGAAKDFFEKTFKCIYPLDFFMVSGMLHFFKKEGMGVWPWAGALSSNLDCKPTGVLIPFQGKLVLGNMDGFCFEIPKFGKHTSNMHIKYVEQAKEN